MQWIYRSKRYYHMENSSIYAHIIPVTYHLTAQSIKDLVEAGNQDELTAAVRKTYYGKRYPELTHHNLDQYYTEIRHKIQSKEARNNRILSQRWFLISMRKSMRLTDLLPFWSASVTDCPRRK